MVRRKSWAGLCVGHNCPALFGLLHEHWEIPAKHILTSQGVLPRWVPNHLELGLGDSLGLPAGGVGGAYCTGKCRPTPPPSATPQWCPKLGFPLRSWGTIIEPGEEIISGPVQALAHSVTLGSNLTEPHDPATKWSQNMKSPPSGGL